MPQRELLELLHESLTRTGSDLEVLATRLSSIAEGEEQPRTTEEVVALGFIACVKALRESTLMQEVAIREEIQELHTLGDSLLRSIKRIETLNRLQIPDAAAVAAARADDDLTAHLAWRPAPARGERSDSARTSIKP